MLLRVLERLVALLFWVAVTAIAFLVATQRTLDVMDRPEQVVDFDAVSQAVADFDPTSAMVIAVAIGLVVLGLAILLMEFTPRRPRSLLHHEGEKVTFTLDRRALERRLARTAESDPDVDDAKVRVRRRTKVKVQTVESSDDRSLRKRVRDRLREDVEQLVEKKPPKVKVDVASGGGRVR
jgi:hypothetical protein